LFLSAAGEVRLLVTLDVALEEQNRRQWHAFAYPSGLKVGNALERNENQDKEGNQDKQNV
jgi:hypothetical protein